VLGTAILVAMVGEPATLQAALGVADSAYLFSVIAALVSGAVVLGLRPQRAHDGVDESGIHPEVGGDLLDRRSLTADLVD